jgi:hypothetical protein
VTRKNGPARIRSALRNDFYRSVAEVPHSARRNAYRAVNFAMVEAYWQVGGMIVEEEQQGKERAEYGKGLLKELSVRLTQDFGKGFDESNLRYIRQFYLTFPNRDALRHDLTWTHYRLLIRVEDPRARLLSDGNGEAELEQSRPGAPDQFPLLRPNPCQPEQRTGHERNAEQDRAAC